MIVMRPAATARKTASSPPRPSITMPSSVGCVTKPSAARPSAIAAMRSDSFTRNLGAAHHRASLGAAGCDEQRRKLVDRQRDEFGRNFGCLAAGDRANAQIGDGLAARLALRDDFDVRPHSPQDLQAAGARRIDGDVLEHEVGARRDRRAHQEERRRRQGPAGTSTIVARSFLPPRSETTRSSLRTVDTEGTQHAFGVVARGAGSTTTVSPLA